MVSNNEGIILNWFHHFSDNVAKIFLTNVNLQKINRWQTDIFLTFGF